MSDALRGLLLRNIFTLYGAQFALMLAAAAFSAPAVKKCFEGLGRRVWVYLALIAAVHLTLVLLLNKEFSGISEEWEELWLAKLLGRGDIREFYLQFRHGFSWPAAVSVLSGGGDVVRTASVLTLSASVLTAAAIYLSALLLFNSPAAAAAGGLLFTFSSQAVTHAVIYKGKPMISMLAAAVFILTTALAARLKTLPSLLFAAAYLAFAVNIRQEFILYPVLMAAGLFLLTPAADLKALFKPWKIISACAVFAVLGLGFYFLSLEKGIVCHGFSGAAGVNFPGIAGNLAFAARWWGSNPGYLVLLAVPLVRLRSSGRAGGLIFLYGSFLALNLMYVLLASVSGFPAEYRLLDQTFPFLALICGFAVSCLLERTGGLLRASLPVMAIAALVAAGVYTRLGGVLAYSREKSCVRYGMAEVEKAAAVLRGRARGVETLLVGSLDQESMWRCLAEFRVLNIQRFFPYGGALLRPDAADGENYPLPFELLKPPVILVRQDSVPKMESLYYRAISRQCLLSAVGRFKCFSLYRLHDCKPFDPRGNPSFLPEKMELARAMAGR